MGLPSADMLQFLRFGRRGGPGLYGVPLNTSPVRIESRGGWTAATAGDTTQTTSPALSIAPVGGVQVADGDLVLIAVTVDHPSTNISAATFGVDQATVFGWNLIGPISDSGSPNDHKAVWFWTKWRTGDPVSFTVTCSAAVEWAISAAAWAGTSDTTPIGTYAYGWETGSTAAHVTKPLTSNVAGAWIGVTNHDRGGGTWTAPAGYTERTDVRVAGGTGVAPSVQIADSGTAVATGTTTTLTSTSSISSGTAVNLIFEIVPFGLSSNPPPQIVYGPVIGAMTSTGFTAVVGFSGLTSTARLQVSTDVGLAVSPVFGSPVADDVNGMTALTVTGLTADTTYFYGIEADGVLATSGRGTFRTDPAPGSQASFSVAFGSCMYDAVTTPSFEDIRLRVGAAGQNARRLIHMGDYNYQDWGPSDTFATIMAMWSFQGAQPALAPALANVPVTYCWDNHDWGGSFSDKTSSRAADVAAAMRLMVPHYTLPATDGKGAWFSYVIGRVRFIQIDPRSQRDNYLATNGPTKTMLGAEQKAWFKAELDQPEPVKIIQGNMLWREGSTTNDRWGSFPDEFDELNDYIDANASGNIGHVYVIAGDRHALAADNGTSVGSGQSTRGVPQAIAIFQQGSEDASETWSQGHYSLEPATITGYGWLDITDSGTSITIEFQGITSNDDVTRVSMTTIFSVAASPTIIDDYDDNSISASWSNFAPAQIAESGQQLNLTTTTSPGYHVIQRTSDIDIAGTQIGHRVTASGNQALGSYSNYPIAITFSAGNQLYWSFYQGTARCMQQVGGVSSQVGGVTYNAGTQTHFAIGPDGGQWRFVVSGDGLTWTIVTSIADPFSGDTVVTPYAMVGTDSPEVTTTTMSVDDFGLYPYAPTGTLHEATAALAVTATLGPAPTVTKPVDSGLAVTATLAADAVQQIAPAAALAATATLSTAADRTALPEAGLAVTATLSAATAAAPVDADAALAVTATLTTATARITLPGAVLAVTATLAAGGTSTKLPAAALAVTATLAAAATRTAGPAAALSVTATLTVGGTRTAVPGATLAVVATLSAGPATIAAAGAALAVVATLVAALTGQASVTPRPSAGTTARPGSTVTARPFAGITPRP